MSEELDNIDSKKTNVFQNSSKESSLPPKDYNLVNEDEQDVNSKVNNSFETKRLKKSKRETTEPARKATNVNVRIPPRSCLQFKIGPPFELIKDYCKVISASTNQTIKFKVTPRIDRGFEFINNEWVGYKRNYLTLIVAFQTNIPDNNKFLQDSYMIEVTEGQFIPIEYFAIKILAKSNKGLTEVNLVQHTSKRDKGPHFKPQLSPLIPANLPDHKVIRDIANLRNQNKMKAFDSSFFYHRDKEKLNIFPSSIAYGYPNECIDKVARFERIQFATSINSKRVNERSKFFKLHVVFGAVIDYPFETLNNEIMENDGTLGGNKTFVYIQELNTPPLIVRGRSPSTYNNTTARNAIIITEDKEKLKKPKKQTNRTANHKVITPKIKNLLNESPDIDEEKNISSAYKEISSDNSLNIEEKNDNNIKGKINKRKESEDHDFLQTSSPLKTIVNGANGNRNIKYRKTVKKGRKISNAESYDNYKTLKISTTTTQNSGDMKEDFKIEKLGKVKGKRGRPRLRKSDPIEICNKESSFDDVLTPPESIILPTANLIQTLEHIENDIRNDLFNLSNVVKLKHLSESKQELRRKIFRSNSVNMKDIELLKKEKEERKRIERCFGKKKDFCSNITTNYNKITTFSSRLMQPNIKSKNLTDKSVNIEVTNNNRPPFSGRLNELDHIINYELQQMDDINTRRNILLSSSSSTILNNELPSNSHNLSNDLLLNSNISNTYENNFVNNYHNMDAMLHRSNNASKDCSTTSYVYNFNHNAHNHIFSYSNSRNSSSQYSWHPNHNYFYKLQRRDNRYNFDYQLNPLHDNKKLTCSQRRSNYEHNHNTNHINYHNYIHVKSKSGHVKSYNNYNINHSNKSILTNERYDTSSSSNKPVSYSFADESQIDYSEIKTFF